MTAASDHDADRLEHPEWRMRRERAQAHVLPWIEETVPLAGRTVLEYGCGQGAVSCAMAPSAARYIAVDIDGAEIAMARDHLQRYGLSDVELHAWPAAEIVARLSAFRGQVDVFLFYAVLEHMTVAERLEILRVAREVVRADGYLIVCETPNRLIQFDHHTARMPFFHMLPEELAAEVYRTSERRDFVAAIDAAAADGPEARREALVRWGTGVSFHEFELVFDDLAAHTASSSYHELLYPIRPVRGEELHLAATLDAWCPRLPPCWGRRWLDMILTAQPSSVAVEHARPWSLRLPYNIPGTAMSLDGPIDMAPGARLPVSLPVATRELHVGFYSPDPAHALRVHCAGRTLAAKARDNLDGVPQWQAVIAFDAPTDAFELEITGGGGLTYLGYRGGPDPRARQGRAGCW